MKHGRNPNSYWEKVVGYSIKRIRVRQGFTQDQLAERIGIARAHMYRIENGIVSMNLRTLDRVANALQVDPEDLFHEGERTVATTETPPERGYRFNLDDQEWIVVWVDRRQHDWLIRVMPL